jgi:hypothetical protein
MASQYPDIILDVYARHIMEEGQFMLWGRALSALSRVAGGQAGWATWLIVQRWLMGTVLASLAVRMMTEARR